MKNLTINVGDYVRTKYGIAKYIKDLVTKITIYFVIDEPIVYDNVEGSENLLCSNEITKSSPNIIDLIEEGDYVNGYLIEKIYDVFETSPNKLKEAHIKYADARLEQINTYVYEMPKE
jgi:hypothetical protein